MCTNIMIGLQKKLDSNYKIYKPKLVLKKMLVLHDKNKILYIKKKLSFILPANNATRLDTEKTIKKNCVNFCLWLKIVLRCSKPLTQIEQIMNNISISHLEYYLLPSGMIISFPQKSLDYFKIDTLYYYFIYSILYTILNFAHPFTC